MSNLFVDIRRPFRLVSSVYGYISWQCNTLCWLKHEVTARNITGVGYGFWCSIESWDQLNCSSEGKKIDPTTLVSSVKQAKTLFWRWSFWVVFYACFHFSSLSTTHLNILPQTFTDVGTCHEPGGIPFSTRTGALFPYQIGDKVTYTCDSCYGGGTISDRRWSSNGACEGIFQLSFFSLFWQEKVLKISLSCCKIKRVVIFFSFSTHCFSKSGKRKKNNHSFNLATAQRDFEHFFLSEQWEKT